MASSRWALSLMLRVNAWASTTAVALVALQSRVTEMDDGSLESLLVDRIEWPDDSNRLDSRLQLRLSPFGPRNPSRSQDPGLVYELVQYRHNAKLICNAHGMWGICVTP
jgi:hypothetical protein